MNASSNLDFWIALIPPVAAAAIAVIGSAYVGPHISNRFKDRDRRMQLELKEREFKSVFLTEITNCVMTMIVAIMKVEEVLPKDSPLVTHRNDEFKNFLVGSHIIQSKIQTYFIQGSSDKDKAKSESLLLEWNRLMDVVKFVEQRILLHCR